MVKLKPINFDEQGSIENSNPGLYDWLKYKIAENWPYYGNSKEGIRKAERLLDVFDPLGVSELADAGTRAVRRGDIKELGVLAATALLPPAARRQAQKVIKSGKVRASHVSRADFDKFSTDFLGTGEGAIPEYGQYVGEHGPGLYFGTTPRTKKEYQDIIKNQRLVHKGTGLDVPEYLVKKKMTEKKWENLPEVEPEDIVQVLDRTTGEYKPHHDNWKLGASISEAIMHALNPKSSSGKPKYTSENLWDELMGYLNEQYKPESSKGFTYDVELDVDPREVPILHRPWRQQPRKIKEKISPLLEPIYHPESQRYAHLSEQDTPFENEKKVVEVEYDMPESFEQGDREDTALVSSLLGLGPTHEEAYNKAIKDADFAKKSDPLQAINEYYGRGAKQKYLESGVPALKYRADSVGEGMNYVVFDPEIIKILKKTPWAAALFGLSAGAYESLMEELDGPNRKPARSDTESR